MRIINTILSFCGLAFVCTSAASAATDFNFSYDVPGTEAATPFGVGKENVVYDVAMKIQSPSLQGFEIIGVTVPIPAKGGTCAPEASAWLSEELTLVNKKFFPDTDIADGTIINYGTEEEPDWQLRVTFDTPFTIPEEGIYVGYSLTVTDLQSWTKKYPVACVENPNAPGSLWVHCAEAIGTYAKYAEWGDRYADALTASAMIVHLRGERSEYSAGLSAKELVSVETGKSVSLPVSIHNYGSSALEYFDYSLSNPEGTVVATGTHTMDAPIPGFFGATSRTTLDIPSAPEEADEVMKLTITNINGNPNRNLTPSANFRLITRDHLPRHRPLIEEYTGLWCGYCPEAYVKIHQLRDVYPEDAVVLAYHCNDRLTTIPAGKLPFTRPNAPTITIDRTVQVYNFELLQQTWEERRSVMAPADIEVDLFWKDESKTQLIPRARVNFAFLEPGIDYRVAFALVEDKLSDPEWSQSNEGFAWAEKEGPYWDLFKDKAGVKGIVYDNVMMALPETYGFENSIPENAVAGTEYSYETSINYEDCINVYTTGSTYGNLVVKNPDNLRVVAYLVNPDTHEVYNAASSCYAADAKPYSLTEVKEINPEAAPIFSEFFSLSGVRLSAAPQNIPFIVVDHFNDGSVKTSKRLLPRR